MSRVTLRGAIAFVAVAALGSASFGQVLQFAGPSSQGSGSGGGEAALYQVDDGTSENSVGLGATSANDVIWLNTFTKVAGAENIVSINIGFGTPLFPGTNAANGTPITLLIYNDPTGGDPSDGVLINSFNSTLQNVDTNAGANYAVPGGAVIASNNFAVGVIIRNALGAQNPFPAGIDETDPDVAARSWIGFAGPNAVNTANLAGSIPAANRGFIEAFGLPGNWLVRANGVEVPEPASLSLLGLGALSLVRRRRA